jgi:subtilase family serine protease
MDGKNKAANIGSSFRWLACVVGMVALSCALVSASDVAGQVVSNNTPRYVATAQNLGAEDPSKVIEVSIWLQPHNRSQFDALAQSLYDKTSPNYRHWLKPKDIAARFAPTAQEAKTIQQFFTANNLKVVKTGPNNFYVRGRGTVGDIQKAFHVQLNDYQVRGKMFRANSSDPYVDGSIAPLVRAISGLDSTEFEHPYIVRPTSLGTTPSSAAATVIPAAASDSGFPFSSQCFTGTETETFSNYNSGSFPISTVKGNQLNSTPAGCGYTPQEIYAAYNLTGLYNEGYTGSGQTIAIIDWCGSLTIQSDANAFSIQFELPQLSSSNFGITYTAPSLCEGYDQGEINLDVEWAHAIAPGANINLVVPPSSALIDVNEAEFDIVNYGLGTVVSGSFATAELNTSESEIDTENLISEIGASEGIGFNFSSGDYGDWSSDFGEPTVSVPADSPWATAVGGVSLALNADDSIAWQSGWGTNADYLVTEGTVYDPPAGLGFQFGSGGGPSNCAFQSGYYCTGGFPKPSYQRGVPGKVRQLPDISWVADPFTGVAILISIPSQVPEQVWQVIGGTSVATPMFAGLWAIANEEAENLGGPPLGQAAPYLYTMPADAIFDVVPVTSKNNVTASVQEPTGTNKYTAKEVMGYVTGKTFVSAIYDDPYELFTSFAISFGSDCSDTAVYNIGGTACTTSTALHTKVGWDNVTGVGTPNAQAFADFFFNK